VTREHLFPLSGIRARQVAHHWPTSSDMFRFVPCHRLENHSCTILGITVGCTFATYIR